MPPKSQEKHSANGLSRMSVSELTPDPSNPRKHSKEQIKSIALSIQTFGFNAPILVDKKRKIIAGHGRYEAAKLLGHDHVPVIRLDHLSEDQARAYMLADNKLTDRSSWDDDTLAVHLKELSELAIEFNIEASGFELAEIDLRIQSLDDENVVDEADEFQIRADTPVSALGDMWTLGRHLIFCGNALDDNAYVAMFHDERASAAFTDPPYNVRIDGHATGKGKSKHREFPMASGEMSETEFTDFLSSSLKQICAHTVPGGLIYSCMDWRHLAEIHAAGLASGCDLLNLCVWVKNNGGMGSLYRSRHELVFLFRNGKDPHLNKLGRFGRNRTNVWNYPNPSSFGRGAAALHPTIKPIRLIADALLDSTRRNDIVLDPFLGSGTTILAAERTKRRCYGIELDPLYVDTAIERWQQMTGGKAHTQFGETYDRIKARRENSHEQ